MGTVIKPLVELPPESLTRFLEQQQGASANHTKWKYFDEAFNAGRPRGFAALQDSEVVGVLGLIPFRHAVNGQFVDTAWTCDWFVDAERATGATGIALLKAVTGTFDAVYHTGGGEITKRLFGRLANFTEDGAIQEYRFALRAGYFLNRARQRQPWLGNLPFGPAKNIPLRRPVHSKTSAVSSFVPGISDSVASVFENSQFSTDFHPAYDSRHVEWYGRKPDIDFYSLDIGQSASALIWHPKRSCPRQQETEWRFVLLTGSASEETLANAAREALNFAFTSGADSLKVLASMQDESLCRALDTVGFARTRQLPFFAFYKHSESMPHVSMSGLSYMDADNATLY